MSANAHAGADGPPSPEADVREEIQAALAVAREELTRKLENGRVRSESKEKARTNWARALAQVCNVERKLIDAQELERLTEDVEQLKEGRDLS